MTSDVYWSVISEQYFNTLTLLDTKKDFVGEVIKKVRNLDSEIELRVPNVFEPIEAFE